MRTEDRRQTGTPEEKALQLIQDYGKKALYVCEDILNEVEGYKTEWWKQVLITIKSKS